MYPNIVWFVVDYSRFILLFLRTHSEHSLSLLRFQMCLLCDYLNRGRRVETQEVLGVISTLMALASCWGESEMQMQVPLEEGTQRMCVC